MRHLPRIFKKFLTKKRPGETLVEVIASFFILTITSSASTVFIIQTNQVGKLVEDRLIAENIASDGIENMIMFRNTNWMKFAKKDECWDIEVKAEKCPGFVYKLVDDSPESEKNYKLILDPNTMEWTLDTACQSKELNLEKNQPADNKCYGLFENTVAPNKDLLVNFKGSVSPPGDPHFYRMVRLTRLDANAIQVESKVQWKRGGIVHTVRFNHTITNY